MPTPDKSWSIVGTATSTIVRAIWFPFRLFMALSKAALTTLCILFLVASIALPVLTTTSQAVFTAFAVLADVVTTVPNLMKRQEQMAVKRLTEKEAIIASERVTKRTALKRAAAASAKASAALSAVAASQLQVAALTGKLARKEVELAGVAAEKVLYLGKMRALKEVVSETTQKVGRAATKMIKADISGMAGQAIPYVGAVVVVAVTAYDIEQTCVMMKELHELDVAFNPDHAIEATEVCGMAVPTAEEILISAKAAPGAALDAAFNALPEFRWVDGLKDLQENLPKFYWSEGVDDLKSYAPTFYWKEGWEDLIGQIADGTP